MKNVLLLLSVLGCLSSVYGQKVDTTLIGKQQTAILNRPTYDYSIKAPKTGSPDKPGGIKHIAL